MYGLDGTHKGSRKLFLELALVVVSKVRLDDELACLSRFLKQSHRD